MSVCSFSRSRFRSFQRNPGKREVRNGKAGAHVADALYTFSFSLLSRFLPFFCLAEPVAFSNALSKSLCRKSSFQCTSTPFCSLFYFFIAFTFCPMSDNPVVLAQTDLYLHHSYRWFMLTDIYSYLIFPLNLPSFIIFPLHARSYNPPQRNPNYTDINRLAKEESVPPFKARILVLSVSDEASSQYIPIMNCIFAAQKAVGFSLSLALFSIHLFLLEFLGVLSSPLPVRKETKPALANIKNFLLLMISGINQSIPIDVCKIYGDESVFLQQASHLTKASYAKLERRSGLLQYLMVCF